MKSGYHDNSIALYGAAQKLPEEKKAFLRRLPTAILCGAGLGWMAADIFPSAGISGPVASAVLLIVILAFNALRETRLSPWIFLSGIIGLLLVSLIFLTALRDGFCVLGNDMLTNLTKETGHIHLLWETEDISHGRAAAVFLGLLAGLLLSAGRAAAFLMAALSAALAAFGLIPVSPGHAVFLAGVLLMLLGGYEGFNLRFALGGLVLALAVGVPAVLLSGTAGTEARHTLMQYLHQLIYDESTNSMPEGELAHLGAWKKSDAPALELTMEEPEKLYLRGMTGEVYTGTSWEKLDNEEKSSWWDRFYYLHKDGFNALTAISSAQAVASDAEEKNMTIRNLSACREHAYLPYGLTDWEGLDDTLIGDEEAPGVGTENLRYLAGSVPEWFEAQGYLSSHQDDDEVKAFLKQEALLRLYAGENYLEIPEETAAVLARTFKTQNHDMSLSEIKDLILDTLDDTLTYTEEAVTYQGDGDFLTFLLERSGSGYSVHYATAAALMLRYFGVPARYVEGYFLPREAASHYEAGETVVLTEENAHAWAEYYLDGIGWIPFETTPGYRDDEELQAGIGDEAGSEKHYSPKKTETDDETEKNEQEITENGGMLRHFALPPAALILALLVVLLLMLILRIIRERRKLRRALGRIYEAENREAIASLYGYARLLLKKAGAENSDLAGEKEAEALNREALFSNHRMSDEAREKMEAYVGEALRASRRSWHFPERIFYRWIKPLYL